MLDLDWSGFVRFSQVTSGQFSLRQVIPG